MDTIEITKTETINLDSVREDINFLKQRIAEEEKGGSKYWAEMYYNTVIQQLKNALAEKQKYLGMCNEIKEGKRVDFI